MEDKFDYITWSDLDLMVNDFLEIVEKENIKYDAILAPTKGGLVPGVILANHLNINDFYPIRIQRCKDNSAESEMIEPIIEDFDYDKLAGKKILITEDILATGKTMDCLLKSLDENGISDSDIFMMVNSPVQNQLDYTITPKYLGKTTEKWIIFPWEKGE